MTSPVRNIHPELKSRSSPVHHAKRLGIVEQVRTAFQREVLLATLIGFVLGGFVPVASFVVCHEELSSADGWRQWALVALVAGGLLFSAKTVYQWARAGFADGTKALGFVVLMEGTMVLSGVAWLSYAALVLLVGVNGIATGVTLARGR